MINVPNQTPERSGEIRLAGIDFDQVLVQGPFRSDRSAFR
jgi:hypothetical protein